MEKVIKMFLGLSLILGIVMLIIPSTFAQEAIGTTIQEEEITGEVVSINAENTSLRVKYTSKDESQSDKMSTFYLNEKSEIKKGEQILGLADLKEGDVVNVRYTLEEGWMKVVTSIVIGEVVKEEVTTSEVKEEVIGEVKEEVKEEVKP